MDTTSDRTAGQPHVGRRLPFYPVLLPVPIVCFVGALATDLAYLSAPAPLWLDFSAWLLFAGLVAGTIAGLLLIVTLVRATAGGRRRLLPHLVAALGAYVVAVLNSFVHARDGWTAVMPGGVALSTIGAVLVLLAGWSWRALAAVAGSDAR